MSPFRLASRVVYLLLDLLVLLLATRMLLRLAGTDPAAGFALFVTRLTDPFMAPFSGLLPASRFAQSSLDWSVLVAIAVYIIGTVLLLRLIRLLLTPPPTRTVAAEVEEDFHEEE